MNDMLDKMAVRVYIVEFASKGSFGNTYKQNCVIVGDKIVCEWGWRRTARLALTSVGGGGVIPTNTVSLYTRRLC